jgi:predicted membrane GTPase involved in stress response
MITLETNEKEGYLEAKLSGNFSLHELSKCVQQTITECQQKEIQHLLADFTGLQADFTFWDRIQMGKVALAYVRTHIKVATLVTPEMLDQGRIGELFAKNRGVKILVTTDRKQASEWLLQV